MYIMEYQVFLENIRSSVTEKHRPVAWWKNLFPVPDLIIPYQRGDRCDHAWNSMDLVIASPPLEME